MGFRAARKAAGIKLKDAAKALNVSRISLYYWEHGDVLPEAAKLRNIASLYKTTVDELLQGNEKEDDCMQELEDAE